jgi:hypothetical protein
MSKFILAVSLAIAFAWMLAINLLCFEHDRKIREQDANLDRLSRVVEKQSAIIDWQSRRITLLERPDEPVYPPRNPGRLGSIDSPAIGSIDH